MKDLNSILEEVDMATIRVAGLVLIEQAKQINQLSAMLIYIRSQDIDEE